MALSRSAAVAYWDVHASVTLPPPYGREAGDTVNVPFGVSGERSTMTLSCTVAVVGPPRIVMVNTVERVTEMLFDPVACTGPMPLSSETSVALEVAHVGVTDPSHTAGFVAPHAGSPSAPAVEAVEAY